MMRSVLTNGHLVTHFDLRSHLSSISLKLYYFKAKARLKKKTVAQDQSTWKKKGCFVGLKLPGSHYHTPSLV